ncbi:hypothetical protein C3K47_11620 [Solitalea longa]|uniref:Uncharacterized protein n=1 Tax=Solitalea longa TaxID=2079460 RepID=A0A2S5A260_9SPHI|nr:hypothetical protein [Solitalea longa]POY36389.1 hypothetical protein C3K47_11620 [Solitalea longa]
MAQNTPSKESVDNDLYFTNVKLSEKPVYSSSSQNTTPTEDQGTLTRYYDQNDPDYYYANRLSKFYYPNSYNAYFDDYYNPYYYHPGTSWSFGVNSYWGSPYYGASYGYSPYYMPSTYFSMSFGFGSPYYGYGYNPYYYNNYLGYYYNQPYYSGAYYPGYYVYNVAPTNTYSNYGPRSSTNGTNLNRPRTYRGNGDAYVPSNPRVNEVGSTNTRPAWRPDNATGTSQTPQSEARPRERSYDGGSSTRESRPTYVAPRSTEGSRSTGGERSSGGSNSGSARPRGRN